MALRALARNILSERPAATLGTQVCLGASFRNRDQWLFLRSAKAGELRAVVRADTGGFRVLDQGFPLHQPFQAAQRCPEAAREFLCVRRPELARKIRADFVAISTQF